MKALGRFWWDFLVGDDPRLAAAVVAVLAVGAILAGTLGGGDWLPAAVGAALVLAFAGIVLRMY